MHRGDLPIAAGYRALLAESMGPLAWTGSSMSGWVSVVQIEELFTISMCGMSGSTLQGLPVSMRLQPGKKRLRRWRGLGAR